MGFEVIQLGAGDNKGMSLEKVIMEAGVAEGNAVRGKEQVCPAQERRSRRDKG
ncbi:MAG: hypothetical protein V1894_05930 [Chloroflexota bacterium]